MGNLIPADVDIHKLHKTMLQINLEINEGEIVLSPEEEDGEIMSSYIESIILLVPMIPVCMYCDKAENSNGYKYYAFAGSNMLKAVHMFMNGEFKLKGMKYYSEYEGCDFSSLPAAYKRRIQTCYLDMHVLRYGMPMETRSDLINRMSVMYKITK